MAIGRIGIIKKKTGTNWIKEENAESWLWKFKIAQKKILWTNAKTERRKR